VFLDRLRVRHEIEEIFDELTGSKGYFTADEFVKFVRKTQKDDEFDVSQAKKWIVELEKKDHGKDPENLYVTGFAAYLASTQVNSIFNPEHAKIHQDMGRPFAHYWVASSHNTYLMGDQLKGESSVQAYINAFNKGCRCVELDCWDGPDNTPIIYHGHTLTTKITFREVLETVRDAGFVLSQYPVILSLEVHCGLEGQKEMAKLILDILGKAGMLPEQFEKTGVFPPPNQLLNKVLLKGKMANFTDADEEEEDEEEEQAEEPKKKDKKDKKGSKKDEKKPKEKKKPESTAKELSDLIHLKAVHFKGYDQAKASGKPWEMSSFAEGKVNKMVAKQPKEFLDYNTRQLSRIYPKGTRFDSSNYDPVPSWMCGSQIVALNYQTGSEPMWTNDGKFLDNGRCGFVLKPDYMVGDSKWSPNADIKPVKTLVIKVISGWQLPKLQGQAKQENQKGEVIDPYVKVVVTGSSQDMKSAKTKVVKSNGFNPHWNAEFKFPLTQPDLAVVVFVVSDADLVGSDDIIAQYSLNVKNLREGYRTIPLKDLKGIPFGTASLLVQVRFA